MELTNETINILAALYVFIPVFAILGVFLFYFAKKYWLSYGFVRFKLIPYYKKLREKYHAVYLTYMQYFESSLPSISKRYSNSYFFLISNKSFMVVDFERDQTVLEIPLQSVLYHESFDFIDTRYKYFYRICIYFSYNNRIESLAFSTCEYNHKLDKKYDNILTDDALFDFMQKNFKTRDEYRALSLR